MISTDEVKGLVERQPKPGSPVLSVYLNTDQSEAINIERAFEVVLKDMLREIKQKLDDDQKEVFKVDAERVLDFVEKYREPRRGLVIFADVSEDFFWTGELQVKVRNGAWWNDVPYV